MNCYFLVEGVETEVALYPKLLEHFVPEYQKVDNIKDFKKNNYCIFGGFGYPNIMKDRLHSTLRLIKDTNSISKHTGIKVDALIIVVDVDKHHTMDRAVQSMKDRLKQYKAEIKSSKATVYYVIQNHCAESWFLGNKQAFPKEFDDDFKSIYADYYNVSILDPEKMLSPDIRSDSVFAHDYLLEMLDQQGIPYSKSDVTNVTTYEYIEGILSRYQEGHLQSFATFLNLVDKMKKRLS